MLRRSHAPHLVEGVHVERQVVEPTFVIRNRTVGVTVERDNAIHEVPDFFVRSMEDMSTIFVYIDAFNVFAIYITAQMRALVYDEAFLARLLGKKGKRGTK